MTDKALIQYAVSRPEAKYVVALEAELSWWKFRKAMFVASAVCIGDGKEFITNAHCVALWCDMQGNLKYPMFVKAEGGRTRVIGLSIHKKYLEGAGKHKICSIAYLWTGENLPSLLGIEPTYRSANSLVGHDLSIIGFGASGAYTAYFGRIDGQKRAIKSSIDSLTNHSKEPDINAVFVSSLLGYDMLTDINVHSQPIVKFVKRDLKPYEAGVRFGMSGGGAFDNGDYVAIPGAFAALAQKGTALLRFWIVRKVKCLAVLGIPMPFMHSIQGHMDAFIPLAYHQVWIQEQRRIRAGCK